MNYIDLTRKHCTLTKQIGYLEDQIAEGDEDLGLVRELALLREEQKRAEEKINEYDARYNVEAWRCD